MDVTKFSTGSCAIGRGLALVGDPWSMLIIRDAGAGPVRFDRLIQSLGIAPNILTRRLKALVQAGVLEKRLYQPRPARYEHVLTAAGLDFLPVLQVLGAWGRRHNGLGRLPRLLDADTGAPIDPVVIDRATGRPVARRLTFES